MHISSITTLSFSQTLIHDDGIHIRPAHVLTLLAQELNAVLGISSLVRNPDTSLESRDIVNEFALARGGFGLLYGTFTEQGFFAGSTIEFTLSGAASRTTLQRAAALFFKLLSDAEMLESGGRLERFTKDYFEPIYGLKAP